MSKYTGSVFGEQNDSLDYSEIEKLLNLEDNSIAGLYWNVEVNVTGKYMPATQYQPEEFEEIDDVTVIETIIEMYIGGDILANNMQSDILESYRPDDSELYWYIVESERKLGADDEDY
jgi:hypothetical protein